ncbi:MAG: hypothetical protein JXR58_11585 [Bacteroidales bacterium]|nr:hypothetical protein [Bacteroidales bacterium]
MHKLILFSLSLIVLIACDNKNDKSKSIQKTGNLLIDTTINYLPVVICELDDELFENSALIFWNEKFLTINDSGGLPIVYSFDENCKLVKRTTISNATNNDWEDLTHDKNFLYIGDFGNNAGGRKDLKVYKVPLENILKEKTERQAETIEFSYSSQNRFNYKWATTPFDCEAILEFKDSLYIFAKDWQDNKTKLYNLPKTPNNYILEAKDSFNVNGLVTGADSYNNKIALCGYSKYVPFVWIFWDFENSNFFSGNKLRINLPDFFSAQIEGICFINDSTIMLSNENSGFVQSILKVSLNELGIFSE